MKEVAGETEESAFVLPSARTALIGSSGSDLVETPSVLGLESVCGKEECKLTLACIVEIWMAFGIT